MLVLFGPFEVQRGCRSLWLGQWVRRSLEGGSTGFWSILVLDPRSILVLNSRSNLVLDP